MSLTCGCQRGNLRQRTRERELASSRSRRDVLHRWPFATKPVHRPPWSVLDWTEYYLRRSATHPRCRRGHAYGDVRDHADVGCVVAHAFALRDRLRRGPPFNRMLGRGLGHVRFAERSPGGQFTVHGDPSRRWPTFAPQSLQEFRRCCWRTTGCWYSTNARVGDPDWAESWKRPRKRDSTPAVSAAPSRSQRNSVRRPSSAPCSSSNMERRTPSELASLNSRSVLLGARLPEVIQGRCPLGRQLQRQMCGDMIEISASLTLPGEIPGDHEGHPRFAGSPFGNVQGNGNIA